MRASVALIAGLVSLSSLVAAALPAAAATTGIPLMVTPRGPRPTAAGTVRPVGDAVVVELHGAAPNRRLEAFACLRKELTDFVFHDCYRLQMLRSDAAGSIATTLQLPPRHPPVVWIVMNEPGKRSLFAARVDTRVRSGQG